MYAKIYLISFTLACRSRTSIGLGFWVFFVLFCFDVVFLGRVVCDKVA